jgi:hypothetical protein
LDSFFDFFCEIEKLGVILDLGLLINQTLAIGEFDSLARVTKPADPSHSLQGFSGGWKLLGDH